MARLALSKELNTRFNVIHTLQRHELMMQVYCRIVMNPSLNSNPYCSTARKQNPENAFDEMKQTLHAAAQFKCENKL